LPEKACKTRREFRWGNEHLSEFKKRLKRSSARVVAVSAKQRKGVLKRTEDGARSRFEKGLSGD